MDLQDLKAGSESTLSSLLESGDGTLKFRNGELLGSLIGESKGNWAGCVNRRPSAISGAERSTALPGNIRAGFATGVCELHTCDRSLRGDELNDSRQEVDMSVLPDP